MSRHEYILAIDHGTTSTRAILFDHAFHEAACAQKESRLEYPAPGWVEQDATKIWLDTMEVISQVINQADISPEQIKGIGLSNQRETTVLWDRKTGLPIYRAIVWQSRQSASICEEWKQKGLEETIRHKTGLRIDPYFSASKIAWILENVPKAREKAEKGELLFGTMDSWLIWKLTGGERHCTDASNASRTLLCDLETLCWDQKLLEAMEIPELILPEIVPTSGICGWTSPYVFFGARIPIAAMAGDQQAALFGQLCLEKGMAKNTYGTGGFLLMNTGDEVVRSQSGLLSTVAWKIGDQVTYALEGSIFASGSLLKWMRDQLHLFEDVAQTSEMAVQAGSSKGVYVVPAFVGLGAPYWDDQAKASIVGLSFGTGREEIVRAGLESMAFQVNDVLHAMEQDSGIPITQLKVDGGAASNDFLLQYQADLSRIEVNRFRTNELTALGAAFLAGLAVGFWKPEELRIELEHRFLPERDQEVMEQKIKEWSCAVDSCRRFEPKC